MAKRKTKVIEDPPKPAFNGIGTQNERSLHAAIKQWYARPGDQLEVKVKGAIIDILRGSLAIEIQTRSFYSIRFKISRLLDQYPVLLVYPIARLKWITRLDSNQETILSKRKSPKTGTVYDLFPELLTMPKFINHPGFSVEVLIIEEEEIRCEDGKGSWRRKGVSILDRRLLTVYDVFRFNVKEDFLKLLPPELTNPFTNKELAKSLKIPVTKARKISYCLKKMELIREAGKKSREILHEY